MSISFDDQMKKPFYGRGDDVVGPSEMLEQAHALASEIEGLLTSVSQEVANSDSFRVRLARAHTLSLLDQLSELIGQRPSSPGPSVRSAAPRDRDNDDQATSGVRRASAWRHGSTS